MLTCKTQFSDKKTAYSCSKLLCQAKEKDLCVRKTCACHGNLVKIDHTNELQLGIASGSCGLCFDDLRSSVAHEELYRCSKCKRYFCKICVEQLTLNEKRFWIVSLHPSHLYAEAKADGSWDCRRIINGSKQGFTL